MSRESSPEDLPVSGETDGEFAAFERQVAHVSFVQPGPPLPRVGQLIAGKYRVDSLLGRGGMGAVFAVTHQLTQRPFAIKWLLPNLADQQDAVLRFWREARAAGNIIHPNVVQVYDVAQDGASHYILMELIDGITLSDRLRQRGRFEPVEACRVLIPVMRGLHAAHVAGVVHRDLKPQNIMLATSLELGTEVPKVLDFGISKILSPVDDPHSSATRRGAIIGTPQYMPLEQLRSAQVDARTDVYAMGVIAYQMLCGALPFTSTNHADLVCQILGRVAIPLEERVPGLSRELARVIAKAMEPEADARYASMAAFAQALEPFAEGMKLVPTGEAERVPTPQAATPQVQLTQPVVRLELRPPGEETPLVAESQHRLPAVKRPKRTRILVAAAVGGSIAAAVAVVSLSGSHSGRGIQAPPETSSSASSVSAATQAAADAPPGGRVEAPTQGAADRPSTSASAAAWQPAAAADGTVHAANPGTDSPGTPSTAPSHTADSRSTGSSAAQRASDDPRPAGAEDSPAGARSASSPAAAALEAVAAPGSTGATDWQTPTPASAPEATPPKPRAAADDSDARKPARASARNAANPAARTQHSAPSPRSSSGRASRAAPAIRGSDFH